MNKIITPLLVALTLALVALPASATETPENLFQNTKREIRLAKRAQREQATTRMVDSVLAARSYIFVANRAITSLGNTPYMELLTYFDFVVAKDTITSSLPFYGNMYSAPVNVAQGPLHFTSTDFQYVQQGVAKGKEKALVMIIINASNTQYKVNMEIFDSATAVLSVAVQNGTSSTFYGHIEPRKPIK